MKHAVIEIKTSTGRLISRAKGFEKMDLRAISKI